MTYKTLADEMGLANARNLNFILGSVGVTVQELADSWEERIPPIECLVVNQSTGVPGDGFINFLTKEQAKRPTDREKRLLIRTALAKVYAYPKWHEVLSALDLKPLEVKFFEGKFSRSGSESDRHKSMKKAIADNPMLVGLAKSVPVGENEFPLPSGDYLDVLFQNKAKWTAIEVKTSFSNKKDLVRGLYQCVKYMAVLEAWSSVEGSQEDVRVILALEKELPLSLVGLKNSLGVEVVENVGAKLKANGLSLTKA